MTPTPEQQAKDFMESILGEVAFEQWNKKKLAELTAIIRERDELKDQYQRLHSQVSGYLHGKEWEHWQKFNNPKYAPIVNEFKSDCDEFLTKEFNLSAITAAKKGAK